MGRTDPAPMAGWLEEDAPAKVNLDLWVTGRRPNGWHELDSLVVFTEWCDRLRLAPAAGLSLELGGRFAPALTDPADNLVLRAARRLAAGCGRRPDVRIVLDKRIPVAAGLGGGSADAAATLRGLSRVWRLGLSPADLLPIAAEIGADVPACLIGRPTWMRGIGERLEPIEGLPALALVLVNPNQALSTATVFAALGTHHRAPPPVQAPRSRPELLAWLRGRANHLEAPARRLVPAIGRVLAAIEGQPGCRLARMTGSGATCFGAFDDPAAAARAADEIGGAHPAWWVTSTLTRSG